MAVDTVKAIWIGGFIGQLPDGTLLTPGESVVEMPRGEATDSGNWQVLTGKQAKDADVVAISPAVLDAQAAQDAAAATATPDPVAEPEPEPTPEPTPEPVPEPTKDAA